MRTFLGPGVCRSCYAKEVVAQVGHNRQCRRCNEKMFAKVCLSQKLNYMEYGSVYGKKKRETKIPNSRI
jgi:heptaprenylglyceryl phosphate synthase